MTGSGEAHRGAVHLAISASHLVHQLCLGGVKVELPVVLVFLRHLADQRVHLSNRQVPAATQLQKLQQKASSIQESDSVHSTLVATLPRRLTRTACDAARCRLG